MEFLRFFVVFLTAHNQDRWHMQDGISSCFRELQTQYRGTFVRWLDIRHLALRFFFSWRRKIDLFLPSFFAKGEKSVLTSLEKQILNSKSIGRAKSGTRIPSLGRRVARVVAAGNILETGRASVQDSVGVAYSFVIC